MFGSKLKALQLTILFRKGQVSRASLEKTRWERQLVVLFNISYKD